MEPEVSDEALEVRRHAQRGPAGGQLDLRFHPADTVIRAELIGASQRGFRIRFCGNSPLKVGSRVRVTYSWGKTYADVVWCHPVGEWLEAGFALVQDDCD
jgi:hypothetical protein